MSFSCYTAFVLSHWVCTSCIIMINDFIEYSVMFSTVASQQKVVGLKSFVARVVFGFCVFVEFE